VGVVSRRDLAAALADTLWLDVDEIADALERRRISPAEADRGLLEREMEDLTDGAEWPWGAS
jgi:predicted RNA-binding protein associated with RNAse of E/G family